MRTYRVILLTTIMVFIALLAVWASPDVTERTYTFTQFGQEVGEIKVTVVNDRSGRRVINETRYEGLKVDVRTDYVFKGTQFPLRPEVYTFTLTTPTGGMNMKAEWVEGFTYTIGGVKEVISRNDVFPLDNNAIADYALTTWLLTSETPDESLDFGLVLPAMMANNPQVIDGTLFYKGTEQVDGVLALKYVVSIGGLKVNIWVEEETRLLLKLEIPAQGVKISSHGTDEATSRDLSNVYDVEERQVKVPVEGGSIEATLSFPQKGSVNGKAVVLVAGSGPTDRDGNNPLIPGNVDNLKEIAYFLAEEGIMSLRYDKRGIGGSSSLMDMETPSFNLYKDDLISCVDFLRTVEGVKEVYVAGHSEGSTLAIMAANEVEDLEGLILLSGPGFRHSYILKTQIGALQAGGQTKARLLQALDALYGAIRDDEPFEISDYDIPDAYAPIYHSLINQRTFVKDWLDVDPRELLGNVKIPVSIIQGDADTQVSVDDAYSLASALPEDKREVHIFPGVDHVLKFTGDTPLPYGDPSRRVDDEILKAILTFIVAP